MKPSTAVALSLVLIGAWMLAIYAMVEFIGRVLMRMIAL